MDEKMNTPQSSALEGKKHDALGTEKIIVALDVGTTKVVAVAGFLNEHGKIEILDYAQLYNVGVVQGEIFNLLKTADAIKHVVDELSAKLKRKINKVIVGISGAHIRTEHIQEKLILKENDEMVKPDHIEELKQRAVDSLILENGEDVLEVIPQYYHVDNFPPVKNPVGVIGRKLVGHFMVVVGNTKKIGYLKKSIEKAGIVVEDIRLQPVASAEATLTEEQKEAGTLLIDIGGGTTDLIIVKDNIIRDLGVIPMGGDYITQEIKHQLHLLPKEAEKIKIKVGSAFADSVSENDMVEIRVSWSNPKKIKIKTLAHIIQAKMQLIMQRVDAFVREYYKKYPGDKLMAGVTITGGGSSLKHLLQLVTFSLSMDTHHGLPAQFISSAGKGKELNTYKFSTVLGLLKIGLEKWDERPGNPGYVGEYGSYEKSAEKVSLSSGSVFQTDHEFIDTEKEINPNQENEATSAVYEPEEDPDSSKKLGSGNLLNRLNTMFTSFFSNK